MYGLAKTSNLSKPKSTVLNTKDEYLPQIRDEFRMENEKEFVSLNKLNKMLSSAITSIDEHRIQVLVNHVEDLETMRSDLLKDLILTKSQEVSRIAREYLFNDYERIYGVQIQKIFSAIAGESNLQIELRKFLNEKRHYNKSLEQCRNYNVFQKKDQLKI